MKILFFGDIVGRIGRESIARVLPDMRGKYDPDIVIANGENMAHGQKITPKTLKQVIEAGVDVVTSGDHYKGNDNLDELFSFFPNQLIRPANYPPSVPGDGAVLWRRNDQTLLIVNLIGRVFMGQDNDDPFRALDDILKEYENINHVFIDFHAEATSEKVALGWYADGRVSSLVGTHTHVPTADARILPGGTAYVSDVGMVGARDAVIGVDKDIIIKRFLTQLNYEHDIPEHGIARVNAVFITLDDTTGKAISIERVDRETEI